MKRFGWLVCAIVLDLACTHSLVQAGEGTLFMSPAQSSAPSSNTPRLGTVGLVREIKERGMTTGNWAGLVGSLFTLETDKDVIRLLYEVTVFFADGSQGEFLLERDSGLRAGQRVRVTGSRIEALEP